MFDAAVKLTLVEDGVAHHFRLRPTLGSMREPHRGPRCFVHDSHRCRQLMESAKPSLHREWLAACGVDLVQWASGAASRT